LLDVERSDTNVIVAVTPAAPLPRPENVAVANVVESPASNDTAADAVLIVADTPSTTTTTTTTTMTTTETTTTLVESTETVSSTIVEPPASQDAPIALQAGQTP
jgi:hypothetical protein